MSNIELHYGDAVVRAGDDEFVCLTDMWKADGSPENRTPYEWMRKEGAAFIEFIGENLKQADGRFESIRTLRGGNDAGTWAHWQIGLAYAKYLSPRFHAWCNVVVRERMAAKVPAPLDSGIRLRELDVEDRKMKSAALLQAIQAVEALGTVKADTIAMYRVKAAEYASGELLAGLLPPAEHHNWISPSAIAEQLGVSANRVGRTISALDLRGDKDGLCRPVMNKSGSSSREVTTYIYSPTAVERIADALAAKAS